MAGRDPNEFTGFQFCGNCGAAVTSGATACDQCGSPVQTDENPQEIPGDYIPYCRACGLPVAREAALNCPQCGVSPLCRDHYYPSTRTCALCPPFDLAPRSGSTQPGDNEAMLRASYGDANYERLVDVKTKYDPQNLFRLNQNVQPRTA